MNETGIQPGRFSRLLNHQWFLLLAGIALGIPPSIVVTMWFERPNLCWVANSTRSVIVKQGEASSLKVLMGGTEVTNDLSAVQVQIWNKGRKAIRRGEVLKPVIIRFTEPVHFLESRVRSVTRPEIVKLALTPGSNLAEVKIDWEILEQGDGAVIQLTYDGSTRIPVAIHGVIEGQRNVTLVKQVAPIPRKELIVLGISSAALLLSCGFLFFTARKRGLLSKNSITPFRPGYLIAGALTTVGFVWLLILWRLYTPGGPPLSF